MKTSIRGKGLSAFSLASFAIAMLLIFATTVFAANINSTKTGNWNDPTAWSTGTVPTAGDNVTIISPHVVSMNANATITNLTINSGATLQFNDAAVSYTVGFDAGSVITVNGTLDMGKLGVMMTGSTGTTTVTMGSTGTLKTSNLTGAPIGALGPGAGASFQEQGAGAFNLTSLETSGTVNYAGSGSAAYVVTDRNYNNLTFNGAGNFTWTLAADRTINATLLAQNPNKLTLVGTQNIFLSGNLNTQFPANGFDAGTSTFILNGTGSQFLNHNGPPLNNVVINKPSGTVTTFFASTVNGSLTITAGTFTPSHAFTVKGPFTNNGTVTGLSGWSFGGDFTNNGTFSAGAAGLTFNGTAPQTIGGTSATTFGSLTINNATGVTLESNATVNGTLTLQNGVFTLTGGLTFGTNATISRYASASLSGSPTFGTTLNVNYYYSAPGSLTPGPELPTSPTVLNGLSVNGGVAVNLTAPVTVNGAFTLASGTLNAGANNMTFKGAFTNNASTTAFNAGTATAFFSGATQTLGGTSATIFNHLTINSTGSVTLGNSPTVNGALTLSAGTLSAGAYTINAKGDFTNNASATAFNGGTGTVIFNGAMAQTIGGTFPTTFYRLTVNNSAGITLNADPTVNNILTLTSGNITTGTRVLTLGTGGSVTRTSGYIVGNFRKNFLTGSNLTKNFEVGTGTNYTPVSLTFPSVSTAGGITATTVGSEHPDVINSGLDAAKDVNRYWNLTNNGLGFSTYNATFNFVTADVDAGADWTKFEVRKYNSPNWSVTTTGTRTATSTQATGLTAFSDFAIGQVIPTTPAPPTLTSPTNGATNISITPTLSWSATYGATTYGLEVATDAGFSNIVLSQSGLTSTSYVVTTPLLNSTNYYWHVNATNVAGTSDWSANWNFTTIIAAPPAPVLSAPTNGATEISTTPTLAWNAALNAQSYTVQVASDAGFTNMLVNVAGVTSTSYAVSTPLGTSTLYYWRVNAANVGGTGAWSAVWNFTTVLGAPTVPTLASPANGAINVSPLPTLNWNPVPGATTYALQLATDAGFTNLVVNQTGLTGTSYNVTTPLNFNTVYYWQANATNVGGTSAWSSAWSFTTRGPATITSTKTGNWNDPTAWSTGYVPSIGDAVVIVSPHVITMNASAQIANLTINSGATLQFTNATTSYMLSFASGSVITVNGTLDMGKLGVMMTGTAGTTTLTMGSTGTIKTSNVNGLGAATGASLQTQGTGIFDLTSLDTNGTINYVGVGGANFVVTDRNYNNLTINSAGNFTWTLAADRTIAGTLLAQIPNKLTLVGTQNIFLGGNLNTQFLGSAFDAGTSTFVFNGTGAQFINHNGPPLNNIIINKPSGVVTAYYASTVNGSFTITAGTFSPSYSFTINGPFTNNGTFSPTVGQSFKGAFINNGTFSAGAATMNFNGTAPQTIGGTSTTTFTGLLISNAAGVTLAANVIVNGSLFLSNGTLAIGTQTLTLNSTVSATSGGIASAASGTVLYNQGSAGQAVAQGNYGNLTFSNFNKTLSTAGPIRIAGVFTPGSATGHTITSSTIEYNGASTQTIPAGFATYNNLTINNSAGATLAGSITVNGALALNAGNITTEANQVIVEATGSVTRTSGHIIGNLRKNFGTGANLTKNFEIGTGNDYTPVRLTFPTVSTAGGITATTVGTEHLDIATSDLNANKSVNRYWIITNNGLGFSSSDATFNFVSTDLDAGANWNNLVVRKYDASNWFSPTIGARTTNSVQATGLTAFSDFAVGEVMPAAPLTPALTSPANGATGVSTTPTLSWNAADGADSYALEVATDAAFANIVISQTGLTATSFNVTTALAHNTPYFWRVNATNIGGTSAWSEVWSFTTIVAAPAVPTLASPANGATGISTTPALSWNAAGGADSYALEVATDAAFTNIIVSQTGLTATSFNVTTALANNTLYFWRVNSTNAGGTSAWSEVWSFTTIVAAPAVPTLASPTNGATGVSATPTLSWNAAGGADSYALEVATDAAFTNIVVSQTGLTATSFNVTTALANNTLYFWRVNATNAGGTSAWSEVWSFTTIAYPEMDVQGNAISIVDGDMTPSTTDDTDFGSADINTGSVDHIFTIINTGVAALNLTGTPKVQITGNHAADFSVTIDPTSPVASGGGQTTFTVHFDPSAIGLRSAAISISNDDPNENPYGFAIQGTGTVPTATALVSGDATICAGQSAPIQAVLTGTAPWSLTWSDGFVQDNVTTSPATRNVNPTVGTTYTVTSLSDAYGSGTSSGSATVTVNPLPTVSINGDDPVVTGTTHTYAANTNANSPIYSWSVTNGTINGSNTGNSVSVAAGSAGTMIVSITVTDGATSCSNSTTKNVTVNSAPAFVFLANKVTLRSTKQKTPAGDIHSNGTLTVEKGAPSTYQSNLTAIGKITINKDNTINGNVQSQTSISNSGKITGTKTIGPVANQPLPNLSYSAGGANKTVPPNGTLILVPGSYGIVTLNESSTLKLTSGEYRMNELRYSSTIKNGVIEIDLSSGNPVTINVMSNLQFGHSGAIRLLPNGEGDSKLVTFNTKQTTAANWGREAYLLGSFNAPYAVVTLVKNTQLRGTISAKEIVIDTDCLFLHHDSPGSLPGPGNLPKSTSDDEEVASNQSLVTSYALHQNYPNPFNPSTMISLALPEAGKVTVVLYSLTGQVVKKLADGNLASGRHQLIWDGRDESGALVAGGVYFYRLIAQGANGEMKFIQTRKMVFVK